MVLPHCHQIKLCQVTHPLMGNRAQFPVPPALEMTCLVGKNIFVLTGTVSSLVEFEHLVITYWQILILSGMSFLFWFHLSHSFGMFRRVHIPACYQHLSAV